MAQLTERNDSIELDDRRYAWRSVGAGPPLALINGYSGAAAGWDPRFLAALGRSFEVICPDNRGIGGSELGELNGPLTADAMAADVEALLDELGIERLPVVGWSMGGFVAQALATRAPERVEALVLLSTNPGGAEAMPADPADFARLVDHSGTPREQASRLIALLFPSEVAPEMDRAAGEMVAEARAELSPAALRAQQEAMRTWMATEQPLAEAGSGSAPPVLAVCGAEDVVIPPENTELLANRWAGCRTESFAGCGHAFMAQEPERLAELIVSFLRE
jgi:pimeloyl-ACP methyl ester carboxylesterase